MAGKPKEECPYCFDTGCSCGGIGLRCHGCCSCPEGTKAKQKRARALKEVAAIMATINSADLREGGDG